VRRGKQRLCSGGDHQDGSRLLDKELDHDDDELTATLKLRRKTSHTKSSLTIIEQMYAARHMIGDQWTLA
jgi:hypothetical protein